MYPHLPKRPSGNDAYYTGDNFCFRNRVGVSEESKGEEDWEHYILGGDWGRPFPGRQKSPC